MRTKLITVAFCLMQIFAIAQTDKKIEEQRKRDSIFLEHLRKERPEFFNPMKVPFEFMPKNYFIKGRISSILLQENYVYDSIYQNFIPFFYTDKIKPENKINVLGNTLNLTLFNLSMNEFDILKITNLPISDSIKLIDSLSNHAEMYVLNDIGRLKSLKITVLKNGKKIIEKKPITEFSKRLYSIFTLQSSMDTRSSSYEYGYNLLEYEIKPNDEFFIELDMNHKGCCKEKYYFKRLPLKTIVHTVLSGLSKNLEENLIHDSVNRRIALGTIDSKRSLLTDSAYASENFYELAPAGIFFSFIKPTKNYPDSSLEYALLRNNTKDTMWITTGHFLHINRQEPDSYHTLLVRYKTDKLITAYKLYITAEWYQTKRFKYISGSIGVILLISLLYWVYKRKLKFEKEKRNKLAMEIKLIRSQLNPHFIFNALNSIQGLMNKNDISGANHYLVQFSQLVRNSLYNNEKEFVLLETELKTLETYIQLEQLRFGFQYAINIESGLNTNAVEIPFLILQPLVENAIKHGVSGIYEKGLVTVSLKLQNKNLSITVADNGKGFNTSESYKGMGLKLTNERIQLINASLHEQKIVMNISCNQSGTNVFLTFENWL